MPCPRCQYQVSIGNRTRRCKRSASCNIGCVIYCWQHAPVHTKGNCQDAASSTVPSVPVFVPPYIPLAPFIARPKPAKIRKGPFDSSFGGSSVPTISPSPGYRRRRRVRTVPAAPFGGSDIPIGYGSSSSSSSSSPALQKAKPRPAQRLNGNDINNVIDNFFVKYDPRKERTAAFADGFPLAGKGIGRPFRAGEVTTIQRLAANNGNYFFIINTEPSGTGYHWTALWIHFETARQTIVFEYFDSLAYLAADGYPAWPGVRKALGSIMENMDTVLPRWKVEWLPHKQRHQRGTDYECGIFALSFIEKKMQGVPFAWFEDPARAADFTDSDANNTCTIKRREYFV